MRTVSFWPYMVIFSFYLYFCMEKRYFLGDDNTLNSSKINSKGNIYDGIESMSEVTQHISSFKLGLVI